MRRLRLSQLGLSEIVGALMLVLIVVVAATAFSAFIAEYQKQIQAEQAIQHARNLEALTVLHTAVTLNETAPGAHIVELNFTIASLSVEASTISSISIDNSPVARFNATELNLTTGLLETLQYSPSLQLGIGAQSQATVQVDLNDSNPAFFSMFVSSFVLHTSDAVQIDLFTALENDFQRVYLPPTAIATVTPIQTFSNGSYITEPVFDGSGSIQFGNSSLVQWAWNVFPDNLTFSGEKVVVGTLNLAFSVHTITLTVTDSDGLIGIDTVAYRSS